MAKNESATIKMDPNTEVFQSRVQAKKIENCRNQWVQRWNWLLEERRRANDEITELRKATFKNLSSHAPKPEMPKRSLKPVPPTTMGLIGWLSSNRSCQLETDMNWLLKIPTRLPDVWENRNYFKPKSK